MDEKECCLKFNPEKWDHKKVIWKNKHFIKDSMFTIFHMPLPWVVGKKISRLYNMAMGAKVQPVKDKRLMLFYDHSAFKSELYMSVTKSVEGENNVTISGTFITKVFDGPYRNLPKFMKQMDEHLSETGKVAKKYYVHYAYCPKCAEKYGHNYMILFAEI